MSKDTWLILGAIGLFLWYYEKQAAATANTNAGTALLQDAGTLSSDLGLLGDTSSFGSLFG